MKVEIKLSFDVNTDEERDLVVDRLSIFDYSSLCDSFEDVLDEFGEVTDIELEDIN